MSSHATEAERVVFVSAIAVRKPLTPSAKSNTEAGVAAVKPENTSSNNKSFSADASATSLSAGSSIKKKKKKPKAKWSDEEARCFFF